MTKKQRIKWAVIVVVVAGLSVWVSTRWKTWFGNPPEPPYTVEATPHRLLLTMGNHGATSRIVTWQADTMVQKGHLSLTETNKPGETATTLPATCEVVSTRGGKTAFYRVELTSLTPGTTYQYRVTSGNKESGTYTFSLPEEKDNTSFIFMGDVQDSVKGLSRQVFSQIAGKHPDADFWLFGGDLVERPIDTYWQTVFADLDTLATSKPILNISGNHEYLKGVVKELDPRLGLVFGYYQASKTGSNHVYTFAQGDARFFLLDSNTDCWNLPAQRRWLKCALDSCTQKWKIVVLHHPLHSNKGKRYNPLVKAAFGDLVKDYGVDLVLQGHEHVYARWNEKDGQGNYLPPLYLSSVCSPKIYQLHFSQPEDRIGTNDRFYQHIGYNADSLTLWTYTTSDMRPYDHVCITKQGNDYRVTDHYKGQPEKVEISDWFRKAKKKRLKEYQKEIDAWKKAKGLD